MIQRCRRKSFVEDLLTYRSKRASEMTDEEIIATSRLFSENYGVWSKESKKAGQQIKLSPQMIRKLFVKMSDCSVALAFYQTELVGHVFYVRRHIQNRGYVTWIMQLVVKKSFRGHSIGTKLMHSIWQLSDSYAWGLYTSNPMTIRSLENATMRKVDIKKINSRFKKIAPYLRDLLPIENWTDSYTPGIAYTDFYVEHGDLNNRIKQAYKDGDFPLPSKLPEGHEWIAIVFRDQQPALNSEEQLDMYTEFSHSALVQAYSNMDMQSHSWSSHTESEIAFLRRYIDNDNKVIDVGCGIGRLTNGLAKHGVKTHGIDFSQTQLDVAVEPACEKASFECADARKYRTRKKYDAAICMYDVIGSFPDEKDNFQILKRIYKMLKPGGIIILSVMSMDITMRRCRKSKNVVRDIHYHIDRLLSLKGSKTMQTTGDVFNGKLIVIDELTGICYRKEQFFPDDDLPIEYLIRDRRYTRTEIQTLVQDAGFIIEDAYYFQAGRLEKPLKPSNGHAKEILVIARKPARRKGLLMKLWN